MFFFYKGDVRIESVYGCLRQLRLDSRDSKYKTFLNCLQIPSDLTGWVGLLGMCLCLRTRQSYLARQYASDSSLRWFPRGSRKIPARSLGFSVNEAADRHIVGTVVVLCRIKFINSSWRSYYCAVY